MAVRKSTSLVVVAALVAAAGTGATLALWETSADLADAEISSGSMSVTALKDPTAADISTGIGAIPQVIELDDFRMVPGDKIRVAQTIEVTTVGKNIAATLDIGTGGYFTDQGGPAFSPYLTLNSVELYKGDQAAETENLIDLVQPISTGSGTYSLPGERSNEKYTIVYEVTFNQGTGEADGETGTEGMTASALLETTAATLTQVRPTP